MLTLLKTNKQTNKQINVRCISRIAGVVVTLWELPIKSATHLTLVALYWWVALMDKVWERPMFASLTTLPKLGKLFELVSLIFQTMLSAVECSQWKMATWSVVTFTERGTSTNPGLNSE